MSGGKVVRILLRQGLRFAGEVLEENDEYLVLLDTKTGHEVRVAKIDLSLVEVIP